MDIAGYVTSGRFTDDARRLGFVGTGLTHAAEPPVAFTRRLPSEARAALVHVLQLVRSNAFPRLARLALEDDAWCFDFVGAGAKVHSVDRRRDLAPDVLALTTDDDGQLLCLHVEGYVVVWDPETGRVLEDVAFGSLDEALFALVHREAIERDPSLYTGVLRSTFNEQAGAEPANGFTRLHEDILEQLEDE